MEEQEEQGRNRLYWIYFNTKTKIFNSIKSEYRNKPVRSILITLVLLYLIYVSRGTIQPAVLFIRKYYLLVLVIWLVLYWFFRGWRKRAAKGRIISSATVILVALACWFLGEGVYKYLSLYVHYSSINKIELNEIPETDFERIQPINSIKTLINQEGLSETEDATMPKFVRGENGRYEFTCGVGPAKEYKVQQLTKNIYEVIHVPADLPSPVFSKKYRDDVTFNVGELLLFSKKTTNAVTKKFSFLQYLNYETSSPIYIKNDKKEWLQVVPLVKWKGIIFPRPVFGGVMVVKELGNGDSYFSRVLFGKGIFYSPEDLHELPELMGQNLIPEKVAKFIAESFRFSNGFLAPLPMYHEGDIRIPALPNDVDPQPFTTFFKIAGEEKLYNFFGLEPYQEDKKGLSLSLFIPGDTDGKVYYIDHRSSKQSFIGSSAISAKIIESKKNYDWTKNYPAESRPFIRIVDGKSRFFWLSTIVTKAGKKEGDYIGGSIPEITLTDAIHGKVVWISQDSLINNETWIKQASVELESYWSKE
jgi:hypothetical protein